jgi:Prokaryotic lipoprotein-attachment site
MKTCLIALALCLGLSACGRRGAPTPPGPAADISYPHVYPAN